MCATSSPHMRARVPSSTTPSSTSAVARARRRDRARCRQVSTRARDDDGGDASGTPTRRMMMTMMTMTPMTVVVARARAETSRDAGGERPERLLERSAYVRALVDRTEANARRRRIDRENRACLRQRAYGVGDCADIDEDALEEALTASERASTSS